MDWSEKEPWTRKSVKYFLILVICFPSNPRLFSQRSPPPKAIPLVQVQARNWESGMAFPWIFHDLPMFQRCSMGVPMTVDRFHWFSMECPYFFSFSIYVPWILSDPNPLGTSLCRLSLQSLAILATAYRVFDIFVEPSNQDFLGEIGLTILGMYRWYS